MENVKEELDVKILKTQDDFELDKEKKIVNLMIEIIVASTLKEYHEKSD